MNLEEYAQARQKKNGPTCTVCLLSADVKAELAAGETKHVARSVMSQYLRDEYNISIPHTRLGNHFREQHHLKEAR
jgi:hypothetical protein